MLKEGWQNAIRFKNKIGDTEGAKKDLLKIRMRYYNKLNIKDKLFVNYCLAFHINKEKNKYLSNYYLGEMDYIFKREGNKHYQVEYHNYLWLNVNVNHNEMNRYEVILSMRKVYDFYSKKGNYIIALSAISSMYEILKEGEKLLEMFENLLSLPKIIDDKTLNEFLDSLEKLDKNLYIQGINLISIYGYKRKVN